VPAENWHEPHVADALGLIGKDDRLGKQAVELIKEVVLSDPDGWGFELHEPPKDQPEIDRVAWLAGTLVDCMLGHLYDAASTRLAYPKGCWSRTVRDLTKEALTVAVELWVEDFHQKLSVIRVPGE